MTSISKLQPTKRLRVYDLVSQAGLDVSDWSNYKLSTLPAANPKYCYEWSFVGPDCVVVCMWFCDMQEDAEGVFQVLNYAEIPANNPNLSAVQKNRRWSMDHAFRTAKTKNQPVRAIIVDGPTDAKGDRKVKNRSLDSEPWYIASYDYNTGSCRLQRGSIPMTSVAIADEETINELGGIDLTLLGRDQAERIVKTVTGVKRDPAVRRAVIKRCKNTCERPGCGEKRDYVGFLDVHHILGAEKSDRLWTCVALCPNCHREAHFSPKSTKINSELLKYARKFAP
jgi:5-methylcytosine-specific restriction protein A